MKKSLITSKARAIVSLLTLCVFAAMSLPIDAYAGKVPAEVLAGIVDDELNPLPRYATPEEKQQMQKIQPLEVEALEAQTAAPSGLVWTPAEYEPCHGVLVRWGSYNSLLTEFIVGVADPDMDAIAWVLVETDSQRESCTSTLQSAGADMDRVRFIMYDGDSVWIRDYGPVFFSEDGSRAIMDHTYNRNRPKDNAFSAYLAELWNEPLYDIGLTHGGGNFHCISTGDAFMSDLILDENPGYSENEIIQVMKDYHNVDLTIYQSLPSTIDATSHIDMWLMPFSDTDILISQFDSGTAKTITDSAAADLESRGYTIWRTPARNSGGTHYTYTNATIVNNRVFIPEFNHTQEDAEALATFQAAMPDHEIIQVDCSSIINAAGAIHCAMKHVYAIPTPFVEVLRPNGGEALPAGQNYQIKWIANDQVGISGVDIYYSTDSGLTYPYVIDTNLPHTRSYLWNVPDAISETCRIRMVVHSADGYTSEDTSNADFAVDSSLLRDDFEAGFGSWTNVTGDKDNWYRRQGSTPSSSTGPDHDNTIGDSSGWYIYMETSSGYCYYSGDEARLEGPDLDADTYSMELSFYYHMYGSNMGTLNVDVYDGSWHNGVWSISGQQHSSSGAAYTKATVNLDAYTGTIKIRFRGVAAGSYRGDMAIDDIKVTAVPGVQDNEPPTPDPMTWATLPYATGTSSISMTAATASDVSGVEYYFASVAGGGNDSSWQDSTTYEDTGLSPETQYTYQVKARDKSSNQNETGLSSSASALTEPLPADTTPPSPDPMMWATAPYATGTSSISMTATTASDVSGVEYYFVSVAGGGNDSSWQDSPTYEDTGLSDLTQYTYRVQARDKSPNQNATAWSTEESATTEDGTAPTPNPMTWATLPYATGTSSISMTAATASDVSGVEYYFACVGGGGNDSGWQDSTTYEDTGLSPETQYTYQVKARDKSSNQNETGLSSSASALTEPLPADTTPPSPDPMMWATAPYATGTSSISMTATTASDVSGVEYYFACVAGGGHDSGWQDSTTYEDTGLSPETQYTYQVKARDKSANQNETALSTSASAVTEPLPDTTPPSPDPMTWDTASPPAPTGPTSISMTATTASDVSGVEYYFACVGGGGNDSGWQDSATYEDTGLSPDTQYTYTVTARDLSVNQNTTASSTAESATTDAGCIAYTTHVESIVFNNRVRCAPARYIGQVVVTVYDNCGDPVANADVTGTFTGDFSGTLSQTTDASGVAVITAEGCVKKPAYQFCVDNITHASLPYASGDNVETCDTN